MFRKLQMWWVQGGFHRKIRRFGYTAVYVGDYAISPAWVYSVGFQEALGQPEVVVFDVPMRIANGLVREIYQRLKRGDLSLRDGEPWTVDGEEFGRFREVHPTQVDASAGWFAAGRMYRWRYSGLTDYRAMQLVLRDEALRYPWEDGYDETLRPRQPALYIAAPDYGDLDGDALAQLRLADERGWSIIKVDGVPPLKWAYTVGLADSLGAELVSLQRIADVAANLVDAVRERVTQGDMRLSDGEVWAGDGFAICLREVHESQHGALDLMALNELRRIRGQGRHGPVRTFQVFLADKDGAFPWDAECMGATWQPQLFLPFDPDQMRRGPLAALRRL